MSHFTLGLIIPNSVLPAELDSYISDALEPYDENDEVEPYLCYSLEEAATDLEHDISRLERAIARNDPDYHLDKCREQLEKYRSTSPEQKYREYVARHENFNSRGEPISTYNPDSKWDWWVIGGRWDGWINERNSDQKSIVDNVASTADALQRNKIPHALITPDGHWHEHGQMGWWGIMLTENDGWESNARAILAQYPDCYVLILDAHI